MGQELTSYKDRWLSCFEQAEEELGEDAPFDELCVRADALWEDNEASLIDKAYEQQRDRQELSHGELDGRVAFCGWCGRKEPSSLILPYFVHRSHTGYDAFYCGCVGEV